MKRDGGIITHWQFHTLTDDRQTVASVKRMFPEFDMETIYMVTGTVVCDPSGRLKRGVHVRTSLILQYYPDNKLVETKNTIYKLTDDMGDPVYGCKDIGTAVIKL